MRSRTIRMLASALLGVLLLTAAAVPAAAEPPTRDTLQFSDSITDDGEACGFPLSWEFTGEVQITRFFEDGELTRVHGLVQESGTVTRTDTGEVVELPRTAFMERLFFADGALVRVEDLGLSIRVTGDEDVLLDVGRFVVSLDPAELLQSAGQHPIREINPFSVSDPALLGGLCDLFD